MSHIPVLPRFLVIGAMKAGTTTFYRDMLASMPDVFLPADKEPGVLLNDDVLTEAGRAQYASLFARAGKGQVCGEASTAYTKRPDHEGVPARARKVLGPDIRLIYLMRHPVDRIAAQIRHERALGYEFGDPNVAVRELPRFVAYSSYAYQFEPWLDRFGTEAALPLVFEDYVTDRVSTLERVAAFLGVGFDASRVRQNQAYNQTTGKPVVTKGWERVYGSPVYRRVVRPWLGAEARERLRFLVLPKAYPEPVVFDASTLRYLAGALESDLVRLHELLGLRPRQWDLAESSP